MNQRNKHGGGRPGSPSGRGSVRRRAPRDGAACATVSETRREGAQCDHPEIEAVYPVLGVVAYRCKKCEYWEFES